MTTHKARLQLVDWVRGLIATGEIDPEECSHTDLVQDVIPSAEGCEECLKIGDEWVFLRLCMVCGKVGCCDNSKNKHATRHYHEVGHPLIKSFEPGEDWIYCYVENVIFTP